MYNIHIMYSMFVFKKMVSLLYIFYFTLPVLGLRTWRITTHNNQSKGASRVSSAGII